MTAPDPVSPRAVIAPSIDFGDRAAIFGLAARRREAAVHDDDALLRAAREAGDDPETRLRRWALSREDWDQLRAAVTAVSRHAQVATCVALLVAALLGWFAGAAALSTPQDEPVNVVWLVQGILLGQSVLLALWLGLQVLGSGTGRTSRRTAGGTAGSTSGWASGWTSGWASIGGLAATAFGAIARRVSRRDGAIASASTALFALHQDRALSRWTLGAVTHAIWWAFNVGCLLAVGLRLTFHRYSFCWESTWLPDGWFAWLCSLFAAGPALLGIPTPDAAMVAASERGAIAPDVAQPREVRQAWTGFLLGAIAIYGILPRGLLALTCAALRRRARRAVRLDPSSVVLDPLLRSIDDALSVPSSGDTRPTEWPLARPDGRLLSTDAAREPTSAEELPAGPPAVVAIEMAIPASGWPPAPARGAEDLGVVASGDDRRAALARLSSLTPRPSRLVLIVSLASPPDRGIQATIEEFVGAVGGRARLVLSGGEAARRRLDAAGVARRLEGWRALAARAGVPEHAVEEIDLDLLTASSSARLRATVESAEPRRAGSAPDAPARSRDTTTFAKACAIIARRCGADEAPDAAALLHVQAEILALYRDDRTGGLVSDRTRRHDAPAARDLTGALRSGVETHAATVATLFREYASPATLGSAASRMTGGAGRMLSLLPPALAGSARWSTAGAIAGGLGCLALAGVAGPALGATAVVGILSGLPGWVGVGAGGGALAQLGRTLLGASRTTSSTGTAEASAAAADERVTAITVAALWTATLEFQGDGEAAIGRALGAAFPTPDRALEQLETTLRGIDRGAGVDGGEAGSTTDGAGSRGGALRPASSDLRRRGAIDEWLRAVQARLVAVREDLR